MAGPGRSGGALASVAVGALMLAAGAAQAAPGPMSCAALAGLALPQAKVLKATATPAGAVVFGPAGNGKTVTTPAEVCRVELMATTSPASAMKVEVWLPAPGGWNGEFLGTGNGGAGGQIVYGALADGVVRGFATVNTDFGTHAPQTSDAFRALTGKPETQADLEERGAHVMTGLGRAVATAYYGRRPSTSLFFGCSAGGGEGLTEALRYPDDYDGIAIGDPPIDVIFEGFLQGKAYADARRDPASVIGREKLPAIARAVLDRCDGLDGLKDGLIDDPRRCLFDPQVLQCPPGVDNAECLAPKQVAALRAIYAGLKGPDGEQLYVGFSPGAEATNGALARIAGLNTGSAINPATPGPLAWSLPADWTADRWSDFDFDHQMMPLARRAGGATSADLRAFAGRGGRLIIFSGWHDALQNPAQLVAYYEKVQAQVGGRAAAAAFSRMFLFPGMGHCGGGVGPNYFIQAGAAANPPHLGDPAYDVVAALDRWVSAGRAPAALVATKYDQDDPKRAALRSRPACAYPAEPRWTGRGSILDARTYVCRLVED